ncbi:MAG: hypothetical protein AAF585_00405 [Verrucomicrobiota bacterium]
MPKALPLLLSAALILCSCVTSGPNAVRRETGAYNRSIVDTQNRQLLLNLVRHKYRDVPYFLGVNSITSSKSTGFSAKFGGSVSTANEGAGFGFEHNDGPTISYAPLQGEDFLKSVLAPIPAESLLVLMQSGWSSERVLGMCAERINGLDNASSASGPTPTYVPRYREFQRAMELLRQLQLNDEIFAGEEEGEVYIEIAADALGTAEVKELQQLLNVPPNITTFRLTHDFRGARQDQLAIRTRSISSILFFLSHNVETPEPHAEQGLTTITKTRSGEAFDWDQLSGDFLRVHTSQTPPTKAFVSVPYRGWWFYIKDNDLNSKSTFLLLTQLFNLQAGQNHSVSPTLTIPVRGG